MRFILTGTASRKGQISLAAKFLKARRGYDDREGLDRCGI
jgi:hypothetical protein